MRRLFTFRKFSNQKPVQKKIKMLFGFSIQTGEEIQIIQAAVPFLDGLRKFHAIA